MRTKVKILGTISTISIFLTPESFASKLKIVNNANDNIQVALQGKGRAKHHDIIVPKKEVKTYEIKPEQIEDMPIFEAIASTSAGNPDWKLLGGICSDLRTDQNYILFIEESAQGLKTSCTVLLE